MTAQRAHHDQPVQHAAAAPHGAHAHGCEARAAILTFANVRAQFAPSKEDVLQNLQYFFGAPASPEVGTAAVATAPRWRAHALRFPFGRSSRTSASTTPSPTVRAPRPPVESSRPAHPVAAPPQTSPTRTWARTRTFAIRSTTSVRQAQAPSVGIVCSRVLARCSAVLKSPQNWQTTVGLPFFQIEGTVVEWDEVRFGETRAPALLP